MGHWRSYHDVSPLWPNSLYQLLSKYLIHTYHEGSLVVHTGLQCSRTRVAWPSLCLLKRLKIHVLPPLNTWSFNSTTYMYLPPPPLPFTVFKSEHTTAIPPPFHTHTHILYTLTYVSVSNPCPGYQGPNFELPLYAPLPTLPSTTTTTIIPS